MPSKKKKYNARFPAGRIKKIMQSDEEIGKVAQAVPVIKSLLTKTLKITNSRNAKTLSTSHMKQCIIQEQRFDFLRELVKNIPDINVAEEEAANYNETDEPNGGQSSPDSQEQEHEQYPDSDTPYDLSMPSTSSTMRRRRADQNGGGSHAMHLRGAPAVPLAAADFSIDVLVDLTKDETRCVNLKRTTSATSPCSSTASSVIMHTKAIAAGNGGRSDCLPPKLTRSESTPAAAHQNSWRPRLKPQHSQIIHQYKNNHKKLLPKSIQLNQEQGLLPPPQTAAAISPAQPIFNYDFCNKPIVKLDYSNLPMSAGVAGASTQCAASAAVAPLSAPVAPSCGSGSAFNFNIAAPVINIDLSNIAVSPSSSETSSSLLDPKAPSLPVSSTMVPPLKASSSNSSSTNNLGSGAATNSNFYELDEDYDNI